MQLSDLYDADKRATDPQVAQAAEANIIAHPLNNVVYADGVSRCRHAKKHHRFDSCGQDVQAPVLELRDIAANIVGRIQKRYPSTTSQKD